MNKYTPYRNPVRETEMFGRSNSSSDARTAPQLGNAAPEFQPIGIVLAQARVELSIELADVARQLAIKVHNLQAIEDGRLEDLPGRTYAVGYVRAYAKYLGLDGEWAVERFRREAEGLHAAPKLEFKSPLPESRLPGGAIMFLSVLISVMAYGGWYYLSSTDQSIADLVPEVPERLAVLIDSDPAVPEVASAPQETQEAARPSTDAGDTASAEARLADVQPAAQAPLPANAPADQADADQAALEAETSGTAASQAIAAISPNDEPLIPTAAPDAPPAASTEQRPNGAEAIPAPPAPSPVSETQIAALPAIPAAPQASDGLAPVNRVVLKARDEVWIQVRDAESAVVTRIMKPGDVYRVPNRDGLTLLTGSAGALDVLVDGTLVPALGPLGAVRRDISLNPDDLKARTADSTQ